MYGKRPNRYFRLKNSSTNNNVWNNSCAFVMSPDKWEPICPITWLSNSHFLRECPPSSLLLVELFDRSQGRSTYQEYSPTSITWARMGTADIHLTYRNLELWVNLNEKVSEGANQCWSTCRNFELWRFNCIGTSIRFNFSLCYISSYFFFFQDELYTTFQLWMEILSC